MIDVLLDLEHRGHGQLQVHADAAAGTCAVIESATFHEHGDVSFIVLNDTELRDELSSRA